MRIVTWNVNSIAKRLPRLLALLEREEPDVVCLQETKVPDESFPALELQAAGYVAVPFGQRAYNGVAILARKEPDEVVRGFPGDPVPEEARVLTARLADLTIASVYVVNGQRVGTDRYERKLAWLDALAGWVETTFTPSEALVVAGDFNVAPDERDVHDPAEWRDTVLFHDAARERLRRLLGWGLVDLFRRTTEEPGHLSWWDYRMGAFHRGWGARIDLVLGTQPVAERLTEARIDRNERRPTAGEGAPSDHAPVIVTIG